MLWPVCLFLRKRFSSAAAAAALFYFLSSFKKNLLLQLRIKENHQEGVMFKLLQQTKAVTLESKPSLNRPELQQICTFLGLQTLCTFIRTHSQSCSYCLGLLQEAKERKTSFHPVDMWCSGKCHFSSLWFDFTTCRYRSCKWNWAVWSRSV